MVQSQKFTLEMVEMLEYSLLRVNGDLSFVEAPPIRKTIGKWLELCSEAGRTPRLVIDLSGVEFLDATGLAVLVGSRKRLEAANGKLALVVISERILKVFRITQLIKVFKIFDSLEDVDFA